MRRVDGAIAGCRTHGVTGEECGERACAREKGNETRMKDDACATTGLAHGEGAEACDGHTELVSILIVKDAGAAAEQQG